MVEAHSNGHQSAFLTEVCADTANGERLRHCIQCGSCGGSCPNGAEMDFTPRTLFAKINANQREEVLRSNTMWVCVSCYLCAVRCPQEIPITEVMYTLKRLAIKEGVAKVPDGPALAKTFTDLVDKYGRSFEFGLASRYYFFNKPMSLFKMGGMGLSMLTHGRMTLKPHKIRGVKQLRSIIAKAREIGGAS